MGASRRPAESGRLSASRGDTSDMIETATPSPALTQEISDPLRSGRYSKEELTEMLRRMCEIRDFEDTVYGLLRSLTIRGASHLPAGQEGVAVAANTGAFHEALNMGATLLGGLPVVYICENNRYGMSVPFHEAGVEGSAFASKIPHVAQRATAYGIPGEIVDGQDVLAVREVVERAVARARSGGGPTLIEAKTYRYYGHSINDPRAYRTREEEREWRQRDPIELFAARLIEAGILTAAEVQAVHDRSKATIEEAVRF